MVVREALSMETIVDWRMAVDAFNRRPGFHNVTTVTCLTTRRKTALCAPDVKCGESHRTNECPIKERIENMHQLHKTGHMANWSQCEEPKRKLRKAALSGASNKNSTPGTSAATEETPSNNEKINENGFGFKDAINELRRFFLDYPYLLEMGRQFRYAKDEERIDIFYQNLINNQDRKA
ncbi:hypothetical protein TNCV_4953381 [Trichonephila clavipes]|nr:hypothetical protein TNCV_4953381 [Trichonephila clavipes]